jgi:hypothetical protein
MNVLSRAWPQPLRGFNPVGAAMWMAEDAAPGGQTGPSAKTPGKIPEPGSFHHLPRILQELRRNFSDLASLTLLLSACGATARSA